MLFRVATPTLAITLLGALIVLTSSGCSTPFAGCPEFDWAEWKRPDSTKSQGGESIRQRMADDIVSCGALDGLTKREVQKRLGPGSGFRPPRPRLDYTLGLCTAQRNCLFEGDTEYLQVNFEESGRVRDVSKFNT